MALKNSTIEMAPGLDWDCLTHGDVTLLMRPGSEILDESPELAGMLDGSSDQYAIEDMIAKRVKGGSEAFVYLIDDQDSQYVIKVPYDCDDRKDTRERTLRLARYGGTCIEYALKQKSAGDTKIRTPRYEAVILTPRKSGVIMSRETGISLRDAFPDSSDPTDNEEEMLKKRSKITSMLRDVVREALSEIGLTDFDTLLDIYSSDVFVSLDGENSTDISEIVLLDALATYDRRWADRNQILWH